MEDDVAAGRSISSGWLALAFDGPALDLPGLVAGTPVRVVPDVRSFVTLLEQARPRIALLGTPPGGPAETELVARERRRWHGLRVVQVSAPEAVDVRLEALRLGFDDAVPSSIEPGELAARLTMLDERARTRPGRTLPVAPGCELDLLAHEVRRDGRLIHLRPKEFDLLAVLATANGHQMGRLFGLRLDLRAQPADVDVDRPSTTSAFWRARRSGPPPVALAATKLATFCEFQGVRDVQPIASYVAKRRT